jgi:xanthine dehydrogenase YagT iron-sulfur-binding subunit
MAASCEHPIVLWVNGTAHQLAVEARMTLLEVLRERLGLTGTKNACNRGECGACTVHVDGRAVNACTCLAVMLDGRQVTTIEGLGSATAPHPMQAAFVAHDALQCGFCTPGQIMSAVACVRDGHARSPVEIREWMSGNLCRCGAYDRIVSAVREVAGATDA